VSPTPFLSLNAPPSQPCHLSTAHGSCRSHPQTSTRAIRATAAPACSIHNTPTPQLSGWVARTNLGMATTDATAKRKLLLTCSRRCFTHTSNSSKVSTTHPSTATLTLLLACHCHQFALSIRPCLLRQDRSINARKTIVHSMNSSNSNRRQKRRNLSAVFQRRLTTIWTI
jgi:hypothetical protein